MKNKKVKALLGFTTATALALGGLVAADIVVNPNIMVAKADEVEDVVFDFSEEEVIVENEEVNNPPQKEEINIISQDVPQDVIVDTPDPEPKNENVDQSLEQDLPEDKTIPQDEIDPDNTDVTDTSNETNNPDTPDNSENLDNPENPDTPADTPASGNGDNENVENPDTLPGEDDIPDGNGENNTENNEENNGDPNTEEEHVHSFCYSSVDDVNHIVTCTTEGCEYMETSKHSGSDGETCLCGFVITQTDDSEDVDNGDSSNENNDVPGDVTDTEPEQKFTQEEYDQMKEQIAQLEQKIKDLEKKASSSSSGSSSSSNVSSSQVNSLNNKVSNLQSQNTALQSQNVTLTNKNRTMAADITSLQNQVSALAGKLNNMSGTYSSGTNNSSLSQSYDNGKKAQVGDIQNLIDSDTYQTASVNDDVVIEFEPEETQLNEVTFDFTAPTSESKQTTDDSSAEKTTSSQTTIVNSDASYAPLNGMQINSLVNKKSTREKAMAAAGTVGSISFFSMLGLLFYGKKAGLLGKKEISVDDLINEEETGTTCPA